MLPALHDLLLIILHMKVHTSRCDEIFTEGSIVMTVMMTATNTYDNRHAADDLGGKVFPLQYALAVLVIALLTSGTNGLCPTLVLFSWSL